MSGEIGRDSYLACVEARAHTLLLKSLICFQLAQAGLPSASMASWKEMDESSAFFARRFICFFAALRCWRVALMIIDGRAVGGAEQA